MYITSSPNEQSPIHWVKIIIVAFPFQGSNLYDDIALYAVHYV